MLNKQDREMIYVERGSKSDQYPDIKGVAFAGFMNRLEDVLGGAPNPFMTMQREGSRERGLKIPLDDFRLFTIGRAMDDFHGELFGEVWVDESVKEIRETPAAEKWEQKGPIKSVPFEPKPVLELLKGYTVDLAPNDTGPWVPAHAVAAIQSLIKEFGFEKVRKVANRL